MEFLQKPFEYNLQIITNTEPSIVLSVIFLAVGITLYIGLIFLDSKMEARKNEAAAKKKKEALQDMILMKDIQHEMDIEMREALIREELRSKK